MNDLTEFFRRLRHWLERRPALARIAGMAVAVPLFALLLALFGRKRPE